MNLLLQDAFMCLANDISTLLQESSVHPFDNSITLKILPMLHILWIEFTILMDF